ncbi:MAG: hypothetical protein AB1473_22320 [Thermodesulfobacteriota bacterium]
MTETNIKMLSVQSIASAATFDLIELLPIPGETPLCIERWVLDVLAFGIVHHEFLSLGRLDRKLISGILKEVLGSDENEPLTAEEIRCRATSSQLAKGKMDGFFQVGGADFCPCLETTLKSGGSQFIEYPSFAPALCRQDLTTVSAVLSSHTINHPWSIVELVADWSEDEEQYEILLRKVSPIVTSLTRDLGAFAETGTQTSRRLTNGRLDPKSPATAPFESSIFKRSRTHDPYENQYRLVSLIACDASGSMTQAHMRIIRMLCMAWLKATVPLGVENLIGLYHSGSVREDISRPLVRWIYHPKKVFPRGNDAARSAMSVPDQGSGVQSDALSLEYMMAEALELARTSRICLTVISDCNWNGSLINSSDGTEEVCHFFQEVREELNGALHACVVGLGVSGPTGMERAVDDIVTIPNKELRNPVAAAAQIASRIAAAVLQA